MVKGFNLYFAPDIWKLLNFWTVGHDTREHGSKDAGGHSHGVQKIASKVG